MSYALNLLIAIDQLVNAMLCGMPDETLSSRAFRAERRGKLFGKFFRPVIDILALTVTLGVDKDHCAEAYLSELQRRQLPPDFS